MEIEAAGVAVRVAQKSKPRHPPVGKIHTNVHFAADGKDVNSLGSTSNFLTKITLNRKKSILPRQSGPTQLFCTHAGQTTYTWDMKPTEPM